MRTLRERFEEKIGEANEDGCWPWLGCTSPDGYGKIRLGGRGEPLVYAHRVSYELYLGPIPAGLTIDHVVDRGCRLRSCVNPAHLEAVTVAENNRRGSRSTVIRLGRCNRGHDLAADGYRRPDGRTTCRACIRENRAALAEAA